MGTLKLTLQSILVRCTTIKIGAINLAASLLPTSTRELVPGWGLARNLLASGEIHHPYPYLVIFDKTINAVPGAVIAHKWNSVIDIVVQTNRLF